MARDSSPRSFRRSSKQDQEKAPELDDAEPPTAEFDEADALFGRRTEVGDTKPAKEPDPEPDSESVESDPSPIPPTPPGVPIPYPTTDPPREEEEAQQVLGRGFGRGAAIDEMEPEKPGSILEDPLTTEPILEDSLATEPILTDLHDPIGEDVDDLPGSRDSHQDLFFEEDVGVEADIEEPPGDLDVGLD